MQLATVVTPASDENLLLAFTFATCVAWPSLLPRPFTTTVRPTWWSYADHRGEDDSIAPPESLPNQWPVRSYAETSLEAAIRFAAIMSWNWVRKFFSQKIR